MLYWLTIGFAEKSEYNVSREFAAEMMSAIQPITHTILLGQMAHQIIWPAMEADRPAPQGLNDEGNVPIYINPRCISYS
jgi:hypothetical protein